MKILEKIFSSTQKVDLSKEDQEVIIEDYKKKIPLRINELVRSFAYKKNLTDKDLKELIREKIDKNATSNIFSGAPRFEYKDLPSLTWEVTYVNGFNIGCYGDGYLLGFNCEYFNKVERAQVFLTDKKNLDGLKPTELADSLMWSCLGGSYITKNQFEEHYIKKL